MDTNAPRIWHLFIDESGSFDAADEPAPACVAGVMVQEGSLEAARTALRRAFDVALPAIPYPAHASHARFGAYHLAGWMLADADQRRRHVALDGNSELRFERGVAVTRALARHPAFVPFLDAVSKGRMPSYAMLRAFDEAVSVLDPAALAALHAEASLYGQRMCELLAFFRDRYGSKRFAPIAAVTFDGLDGNGSNSYPRTLEVLLERVFAFLRARPPARHTVWVHASSLRIDAVTDSLHVQLRASDVGQAIRVAERFPLDPPAGPTDPFVRLVPDTPSEYREQTHPGIVLADFVANRLFAAVHRAARSNKPWHAIARDLADRTGLTFAVPVACIGGEFAPSVASVGAAATAIRTHWSPPRVPTKPGGDINAIRPQWARDQAAAWARLAVRVP